MRNTRILIGCAVLIMGTSQVYAAYVPRVALKEPVVRDTIAPPEKAQGDSTEVLETRVWLKPDQIARFPAVSLQQYLKDQAPGLYVQEGTGEPGTVQPMYVRGVPMPILTQKEIYQAQPLVILDGIPLIGEHPFAFDIQQYQFDRIGPATNLLTNINLNNVESIEVLKDPGQTAVYGPLAANGVIVIRTKQPTTTRKISFNSYIGMAQRPLVTTINGEFENAFRRQFYDRYTAIGSYTPDDTYPLYLSDSLNTAYYGPSNWTDSYYRNGLLYSADADISGGSDRANFRFAAGHMRNEGAADQTSMQRYSALFSINMKPVKWLEFSTMINANRVLRDRNRSLRDRFATMSYLPDLAAPLSPNNDVYRRYLAEFKNGFDDNATNIVEGYARLTFDFNRLKYVTRLAVDYNEGARDLFFPRPLTEENNFVSNYYGYNQRLVFDHYVSYDALTGGPHELFLEGGSILQWDSFKYNYAYAYKGISDYIKINLLDDNLNPIAFPHKLIYKFLDYTKQNLVSFYGRATYRFDDRYTVALVLRSDGSSNAQPTSRWLFTPTLSLGWNVRNDLLKDESVFSTFNVRASAGRLGRLNAFDNFSQGPSYSTYVGFTGNVVTPGYNGFGVLTRPYEFGWSGYGIPWAYTDQINVGLDLGLHNERIRVNLDWYSKWDRNQLLGIPSYAEYGYRQAYEAGMDVKNTGVELSLGIDAVHRGKFTWTPSLSVNYNNNKLVSLPRGLNELVIGDQLLRVGERVDHYWLLQNDGIYLTDDEVPVQNGRPMHYNGITLRAGDPRWVDVNGDNGITDADRVLKGNVFPKVVGGFMNHFTYGNWSLDAIFYFNAGRHILNTEMANRFDFINREGTTDMNSVKEITFWEKRGDYDRYPLYNPWSNVIPYRKEQDLFLENGSFLKLRTVSLGYDLTSLLNKGSKIERIFIYCTGHNLFTITPYSGRDPELANFLGYDTGHAIPIPRTYTLGVRMNL